MTAAATLPPALPGLDPAWSRLVAADDADGVGRTWHVLDNGAEPTAGTMFCVHGNPTWSYLWRRFITHAPPGWRVVAVDQLGMGFSERTEQPRTFAQRVADLSVLSDELGVTGTGVDGPIVSVGHDWGGPISLGWALEHRAQLRGIVLGNTGVHQPADSAAPTLIRLARTTALRTTVCESTPIFVHATSALSRPALDPRVRGALAAPYRGAGRRRAIADFVADIPLEPEHPSSATLDGVAAGLAELCEVPVLALWGPRDPVFSDLYLRDLLARLPHAQVHRYETASHLVTEDAPQTAQHTWEWIGALRDPAPDPAPRTGAHEPVWAALDARARDPAPAVVELGARRRTISFDQLVRRVRELAAGLVAHGVAPGDRVAMLVPPGADLTAAAYACWRIGASVVVAEAGLGPAGLARALRGAAPAHVIGVARGLVVARAMGIPGRLISAGPLPPGLGRLLGAPVGLAELARLGRDQPGDLPPGPDADAECAVLFTSGATGPPKGVVYRHRQVRAQVDLLRSAFGLTADDRLVAAFPPFSLYGPALGIASAVPAVAAPGRLTAAALAEAAVAVDATVVFASPAALRSVVATADGVRGDTALGRVRLVVSAGAPVPAALLHTLREVLPAAVAHTPYGMTEALPVTDITLAGIDAAGTGDGVCVGPALPGVWVRVSPLGHDGAADGPLTDAAAVTGEVCVRAAHVKDRYDRLWATERASSRNPGWHRTGDVGRLDAQGRLWVQGRLPHVVTTAAGPVTPVGIEQRVQKIDGVGAAAVVGVGPVGTQQVVVVVEHAGRAVLAGFPLAAAVRVAAGTEVAAVLVTDALPVDIRHASKIDRARVARWAERVLAGRRAGRRP